MLSVSTVPTINPDLIDESSEKPQNDVTEDVNLNVSSSLTCNMCLGASFSDVGEQRLHFKSDWHRYNVKVSLQLAKSKSSGAKPVNEEEFSKLVAGVYPLNPLQTYSLPVETYTASFLITHHPNPHVTQHWMSRSPVPLLHPQKMMTMTTRRTHLQMMQFPTSSKNKRSSASNLNRTSTPRTMKKVHQHPKLAPL